MRGTVEVHRGLAGIASDWDALAEDADAAPWLRPAWFVAWRDAFGTGEPRVFAARVDGRVTAVLPMQRVGPRLVSATNYHTPSFAAVGCDPDSIRAVARAAFATDARTVNVMFVPAGDERADALIVAARSAGRQTLVRTIERSPVVDTTGSWEAYAAARRGHLLRELRRRRRRLEEAGRVEFGVVDGGDARAGEIEALLSQGLAVEASGWKGERGTAIASRAATRQFYGEIARWAAHRGWLRLAFLRLDGRAIAFDFAIEHERVHYLLKTGFDPAFRRFAPGMLIRQEMLRRAFSSEVARYEFLGHDDPWKLEWADATADELHLQAFRPTPIGLAEWAGFAVARPLARRVRARRGARPS